MLWRGNTQKRAAAVEVGGMAEVEAGTAAGLLAVVGVVASATVGIAAVVISDTDALAGPCSRLPNE
jgi:hypothetical protein